MNIRSRYASKKSKRNICASLGLTLAIVLIFSCSGMEIQRKSSIGFAISSYAEQGSRALEPIRPSDLHVVAYTVQGSGPEGESFDIDIDLSTDDTIGNISNLSPGEWVITAIGKNSAGIEIVKYGPQATTLMAGQKTTVNIVCIPLPGAGSFSLTLTWPAEAGIANPLLRASLESLSDHSITQLVFNDLTAYRSFCTAAGLANGNYLLTISLSDGSDTKWSASDLVVIFADMPSSANWTLEQSELSLGSDQELELSITSQIDSPINITLSGYYEALMTGEPQYVIAQADIEPDSWQWYLDGEKIDGEIYSEIWLSGENFIAENIHSLSVVAQTGDMAGVATVQFLVTARGVTTLAGTGATGSTNGFALGATFTHPSGIAIGPDEGIYISDSGNNKIRRLAEGKVSTFTGGVAANLYGPTGLAFDAMGDLYVADTLHHQIKKITPTGTVTVYAGSGNPGDRESADKLMAEFNNPTGLAFDSAGNLYVSDTRNNKIKKISAPGGVTTYAGSGNVGSTNGFGLNATFNYPVGLAFDASGNLYVADSGNNQIRKINTSRVVSLYAGSGAPGSADGPALASSFYYPSGLAMDGSANLYVTDSNNNRIRVVLSSGTVTTLAGTGLPGSSDGLPTAASFDSPLGIAADSGGNTLYIADTKNNRIRKLVR